MTTDTQPKRRGRPALPPDQRLSEYFPMWVSQAQRAKIERLGGPEAIRRLIDRAKEPASE